MKSENGWKKREIQNAKTRKSACQTLQGRFNLSMSKYTCYMLLVVSATTIIISACAQKNDYRKESRKLVEEGKQFQADGDNDHALEKYKAALSICQENEDNICVAWNYIKLGTIYTSQGLFKPARMCLNRAAKISKTENDEYLRMVALESLGTLSFSEGRLVESIEHFEKVIEYSRKKGKQKEVGDLLCNIGKILQKIGNHKEAQEKYLEATEIYQSLGLEEDVLKIKNHLAN